MIYPGHGKNQHAQHHFREYDMNELVQFVNEAGGQVIENYFSGCWDNSELLNGVLREHPEQKANLEILY